MSTFDCRSEFCRSKGGKVWGSDTANIENWKATRRLVGHQSGTFFRPLALTLNPSLTPSVIDVANVAWSPDDSHLASVGLDNQVLIWSGTNFGNFPLLFVSFQLTDPVYR